MASWLNKLKRNKKAKPKDMDEIASNFIFPKKSPKDLTQPLASETDGRWEKWKRKSHTEEEHETVPGIEIPATCTEPGLTAGAYCRICEKILVKSEVIPPLGHDPITIPAVLPTCVQNGWTEGVRCLRCGIEIVERKTINPLGHEIVIVPGIAPTCEKAGKTRGEKCKRCGEIIKPQMDVPPHGHDIVVDLGVAPMWEKEGKTKGTHCSICGKIIEKQRIIPAIKDSNEQKIAPQIVKEKMDPGKIVDACADPTVVVYVIKGNKQDCSAQNHHVEQYYALFWAVKQHRDVYVPIHRCADCKMFFVRQAILEAYEEKYGELWHRNKHFEVSSSSNNMFGLKDESTLHALGYHVGKDDYLSSGERREKLRWIIESGKMHQQAVMDHLALLIKLNQHKDQMRNAVETWRQDLAWLAKYQIKVTNIHGEFRNYKKYKK